MNRPDAWLAAIDRYANRYPDESDTTDRVRQLISERPDCLDRVCRPGHLTASAWVVSADGERHLLLHHRKLDKWLQPGGHADGDPDLPAVAIREAEEETGLNGLEVVADENGALLLDLDVHAIPARSDRDGAVLDSAHEHHDFRFLLRATGDQGLVGNEESNAVRWATAAEVHELTDEWSVLRLLRKATERLEQVGG